MSALAPILPSIHCIMRWPTSLTVRSRLLLWVRYLFFRLPRRPAYSLHPGEEEAPTSARWFPRWEFILSNTTRGFTWFALAKPRWRCPPWMLPTLLFLEVRC